MCIDPMSLGAIAGTLSTTMQAASAVMGVVGAVNQYNQQNQIYAQNRAAASDAAIRETDAELARQSEEAANNTRKRMEAMRQGRLAQGTALASSQNEGNSTNLVMRDLARQVYNQINLTDANQKIQQQQGLSNLEAIGAQYKNRVGSVAPGNPDSLLASVVSGVGKTFSLYSGLSDLKNPTSTEMGGQKEGRIKYIPQTLGTGNFYQTDWNTNKLTVPYTRSKSIGYGGAL